MQSRPFPTLESIHFPFFDHSSRLSSSGKTKMEKGTGRDRCEAVKQRNRKCCKCQNITWCCPRCKTDPPTTRPDDWNKTPTTGVAGQTTELLLRRNISLVGSLFAPLHCFGVILGRTKTILIQISMLDRELTIGIRRVGSLLTPFHCLGAVFTVSLSRKHIEGELECDVATCDQTWLPTRMGRLDGSLPKSWLVCG